MSEEKEWPQGIGMGHLVHNVKSDIRSIKKANKDIEVLIAKIGEDGATWEMMSDLADLASILMKHSGNITQLVECAINHATYECYDRKERERFERGEY